MLKALTAVLLLAPPVQAKNSDRCRFQSPLNTSRNFVSTHDFEEILIHGNGYDRDVRPGIALHGHLTAPADNITVQIYLVSFEINEMTQTLELRAYLRTIWYDPRLAYESPNDVSECGSSLQVGEEKSQKGTRRRELV